MLTTTSIQVPENASLFLHKCAALYEALTSKIRGNQNKERNAQLRIQHNFEIANNYTVDLNALVENYEFENEGEEIFFFKRIKPAFIAEIEFQSFCYHTELFKCTVEDNDPMETELFYRRQLLRMDRFRRENKEFFEYAIENSTHKDACWFTRTKDFSLPQQERQHTSPYDKQMGTYLALTRYMNFIEMKLNELSTNES